MSKKQSIFEPVRMGVSDFIMRNNFSASALWPGPFNEDKLRQWAQGLRKELRADRVSLGMVFMTPDYFECAAQVLEILRVHGQAPLLLGCSGAGLIAGSREMEGQSGVAVSLLALPGADLRGIHLTQSEVEQGRTAGDWHSFTEVAPSQVNGWLLLADPFSFDVEALLRAWEQAYPKIPVQGGLASAGPTEQNTQLYLNGDIFTEGAVALACGGQIELLDVISQGCTPIGETWTITKAERNIIHQIGNRPAYAILAETFESLSPEEQEKTRGNLFIGLVINEYLENFRRGDFLVRNILGGDPVSGSLLVGALPRPGQTLQFQRRDAAAATEDMIALLDRLRAQLAGRKVYGACLFNCNGRGRHLFGHPDHDAGLVQEKIGPLDLTGFFCNGEIGPVGQRNFVHGYTASLALFTGKPPAV